MASGACEIEVEEDKKKKTPRILQTCNATDHKHIKLSTTSSLEKTQEAIGEIWSLAQLCRSMEEPREGC